MSYALLLWLLVTTPQSPSAPIRLVTGHTITIPTTPQAPIRCRRC